MIFVVQSLYTYLFPNRKVYLELGGKGVKESKIFKKYKRKPFHAGTKGVSEISQNVHSRILAGWVGPKWGNFGSPYFVGDLKLYTNGLFTYAAISSTFHCSHIKTIKSLEMQSSMMKLII